MTPEALKDAYSRSSTCASRLRLPLRSKVWRGGSGDFSGAGTGSSMDFQDHRNYAPGDDPRHINWQAYARTGQYTMKLYREEVRPVVDLICDVSPSMFLDETKSARTAELLSFFHSIFPASWCLPHHSFGLGSSPPLNSQRSHSHPPVV